MGRHLNSGQYGLTLKQYSFMLTGESVILYNGLETSASTNLLDPNVRGQFSLVLCLHVYVLCVPLELLSFISQ